MSTARALKNSVANDAVRENSAVRVNAMLRITALLATIGLTECLLVQLAAISNQRPWLIIFAIALGMFLQLAVSSRHLFWFETQGAPNGIANGRFVIQSILSIAAAVWNGFWLHQYFDIQMATVSILCITVSQIPICLRVMQGRMDRFVEESPLSQLTNFRIVDVMAILIIAATMFSFADRIDWVNELLNPAFFVVAFIALCSSIASSYAPQASANLVRIATAGLLLSFCACVKLAMSRMSLASFETVLFAVSSPTICVGCCEYLLWVGFYRLHRVSE